jgi:hypothetical protein
VSDEGLREHLHQRRDQTRALTDALAGVRSTIGQWGFVISVLLGLILWRVW